MEKAPFKLKKRSKLYNRGSSKLILNNTKIRKSKTKSLQDFCEKTNNVPVAPRLHKTMAMGRKQDPRLLLKLMINTHRMRCSKLFFYWRQVGVIQPRKRN